MEVRDNLWNHFSPPTMWVLRIKLLWSGLVASVSTHRVVSLAPSWIVLAFLHGMGLLCASFWSRDTGLLSDF